MIDEFSLNFGKVNIWGWPWHGLISKADEFSPSQLQLPNGTQRDHELPERPWYTYRVKVPGVAVRADTFQGHTIGFGGGVDSLGAGSFSLAAGGFAIAGTGASFSIKHAIVSNGTDGTPRISDRTQSKSIDASYFMRIR